MKLMILMMIPLFTLAVMIVQNCAQDEGPDPKLTEVWDPEPEVVTPGVDTAPPSDAIVLFDGSNFDEWVGKNNGP